MQQRILQRLFIIALTLAILIPTLRWTSVASSYAQAIPGMVIGTGAADLSAILTINFTNRGVLFPRMTTAERDAINGGSFANGLLIYNNEDKVLQVYDGSSWQAAMAPVAP